MRENIQLMDRTFLVKYRGTQSTLGVGVRVKDGATSIFVGEGEDTRTFPVEDGQWLNVLVHMPAPNLFRQRVVIERPQTIIREWLHSLGIDAV